MTAPGFPASKTLIGAHIELLDLLEQDLSHGFGAARVFKRFLGTVASYPLLDGTAIRRAREGRLPLISFKPILTNGHPVKYWELKKNVYGTDSMLRAQRDLFRANPGVNVILVFGPEPDSTDENLAYGRYPKEDPRAAQDFREAYHHVMDIFDEGTAGTPNVRFASVNTGGNIDLDWSRAYYVTRAYYLGGDPYNWCAAHSGTNETFTFGQISAKLKAVGSFYNKPIVMPEFASWYNTSDPSMRAAFIDSIPAALENWSKLKVACYFSVNAAATSSADCDWRLNTQAASMDAMDSVLGNTLVRSV